MVWKITLWPMAYTNRTFHCTKEQLVILTTHFHFHFHFPFPVASTVLRTAREKTMPPIAS